MRRITAFALALLLALVGGFGSGAPADAREQARANAVVTIALADLPPEARDTLKRIERGGPFPFPRKDGSTFGNFEKRLPIQPRGYYREYTVPTPGSRDRGARRIVAGSGPDNDVARSGEYYYSDDHYRSLRRIRRP
jgi:ribonuclease T1